jgi:glc operon protein GlcG
MTSLTLQTAQEMIAAGVEEAERLDTRMSIAVCDGGGHMVAMIRMDSCMLLAAESVQAKARTAVYFGRPTAETVERSRNHPTVYDSFVAVSSAPILMSMGGIPFRDEDGAIVGAVAAAGGTGAEDVIVAKAAASHWPVSESNTET